jgi:hypothetical protein
LKKLFNILLVVSLLPLISCKAGFIADEAAPTISGTDKILLLPFKNMAKIYGENVSVRCPVCGKVVMVGKVVPGVERDLTEKTFALLTEEKNIHLIPPSQAEGALTGLMLRDKTSRPQLDVILDAGRKMDADAVIYGYVYRYQERVGTTYAIDSPASVAFDIHLIRTSDGSLIWNGHFDETQQSLSENLLKLGAFIKRRAKWVSASEMAEAGLEEVLKTFPGP